MYFMMLPSCQCFKISAMINSNGCWSLEGLYLYVHDVPYLSGFHNQRNDQFQWMLVSS